MTEHVRHASQMHDESRWTEWPVRRAKQVLLSGRLCYGPVGSYVDMLSIVEDMIEAGFHKRETYTTT